jgi:hypothetical protein
MNDLATEQEVLRKLLETLHVNVPERAALPGNCARFSRLVAAVRAAMAESPWFPSHLRPERSFTGAIIEARGVDTYWVHERHEIGLYRYSETTSQQVESLEEAVRRYVKVTCGDTIDGVPIDWGA